MAQQLPEPKDYKYAIIIDGVAYLLTERPAIDYAMTRERVHIMCGEEFQADLSRTASWILIPYQDWLSSGAWKR